jgi:fluoride exporter
MTPAAVRRAGRSPTERVSWPGAPEEDAVGRFLLVCVGGALGSGARYLVANWAAAALPAAPPFGTLLVNVAGSFFIAVVMDLSLRAAVLSPEWRIFLATGIAGGFTTYSSFNHEALRFVEERAYGLAAAYVSGMLVLCAAAGLLGLVASRLATDAVAGLLAGGR